MDCLYTTAGHCIETYSTQARSIVKVVFSCSIRQTRTYILYVCIQRIKKLIYVCMYTTYQKA